MRLLCPVIESDASFDIFGAVSASCGVSSFVAILAFLALSFSRRNGAFRSSMVFGTCATGVFLVRAFESDVRTGRLLAFEASGGFRELGVCEPQISCLRWLCQV